MEYNIVKTARNLVHLQPSVLMNAISWANREEELPVLSLVTGAQNITSEGDEPEEVARTNDSPTVVVKTVGEKSRMDAWLKLRTPAHSVPVTSKRIYVQQELPDGSTVEVVLRKRCKGKLTQRRQAQGDSNLHDSTVQVLPFKVVGERESRSEDQRADAGVVASNKVAQFPTTPEADALAVKSFVEKCLVQDSILAYCHELATLHHEEHCKWTGGDNTQERWLQKDIVAKSDAQAEAVVEDSNIDEFRGPPIEGVSIGTKSYDQWEASRNSALEKERERAEHEVALVLERRDQQERLRYQRALRKGSEDNKESIPNSRLLNRVTKNVHVGCLNAVSLLSKANPYQSAHEQRYKKWLETSDASNPIIDSSRISYIGKWLGHVSLNSKGHEVVGEMKRLNDKRTAELEYTRTKAAKKAYGTRIGKVLGLLGISLDKPSARKTTAQATPQKTSKVNAPITAVVRKIPEPTYLDKLIRDEGLYANIGGTMVRVSHDAVRSALM